MNKGQNSAISPGIGRIFFLSLLLVSLCGISCTAGTDDGKRLPRTGRREAEETSLQQQLRNSPEFQSGPLSESVDSMVVYKSKRLLYAFHKGRKLKAYVISLGQAPVGRKQFRGDNKTPEGIYYINDRNAGSAYHKNLGISYPNDEDRANARRKGLPAGGDVKIHGLPATLRYPEEAYLYSDWTWGCIAVSNAEIDELFTYVKPNTVLLILP